MFLSLSSRYLAVYGVCGCVVGVSTKVCRCSHSLGLLEIMSLVLVVSYFGHVVEDWFLYVLFVSSFTFSFIGCCRHLNFSVTMMIVSFVFP